MKIFVSRAGGESFSCLSVVRLSQFTGRRIRAHHPIDRGSRTRFKQAQLISLPSSIVRRHADPAQHVSRCDRAQDCHDGAFAAGGGRVIGFRVGGHGRISGGWEIASRRRDGLQPDGDSETDHLMVRTAEVCNHIGFGGFFWNLGQHDRGNAAGFDGSVRRMADNLPDFCRDQSLY